MKIQIISDTHFEFFGVYTGHMKTYEEWLVRLAKEYGPKVDAVILSGDIHVLGALKGALELFCEHYKHVLYVPGNHEYYHEKIVDAENKINALGKKLDNLHILNDEILHLGNQRFIGGTLWFPHLQDNFKYKNLLSDFSWIYGGFEQWAYAKNKKFMDMLAENVNENDIVITHHLPTYESVPIRFKHSNLNRFFVCDCTEILEENKPKLWIHGHTHKACDYMYKSTRIVCNPLGYPMEPDAGFREDCIISDAS